MTHFWGMLNKASLVIKSLQGVLEDLVAASGFSGVLWKAQRYEVTGFRQEFEIRGDTQLDRKGGTDEWIK